ncbi:OmpL47-type beta-barrel domain-containing protein [Brevibacillus ginsengisoli]|uniref:OmpL47-type beta-barrel domain-containing protein n=1 Tax=Brevibacillus ginsengisoli TaxID=363854 RepID=UPI003CF004CC
MKIAEMRICLLLLLLISLSVTGKASAFTVNEVNHDPVISITDATLDQFASAVIDHTTISITGMVSDEDGDDVTVSATIGGVTKKMVVHQAPPIAESDNFFLSWDVVNDNLTEGEIPGLSIVADDGKSGRSSATYVGVISVDKTAPGIPTIQFRSPEGFVSGSSTKQPVSFDVVDGSDHSSGTLRSQYRLKTDNEPWGDWIGFEKKVTIRTAGTTQIEAITIDQAGNESTAANAEVIITPSSLPTITLTNPNADLYAGGWMGHNTVTITGKVSHPDGAPVLITAKIGGVEKSVIVSSPPTSLPDSDNFTMSWDVYDAPIRPQQGLNKDVAFVATDSNGGESQAIYAGEIWFDVTSPTKPTIQFTSPPGYTSGKQTDQNVTFTIEGGTDDDSGVKGYAYQIGGPDFTWGPWINYTGPVTIKDIGFTFIRAATRDKAENMSDWVEATVYINHATNFSFPNAHDQIVSDREGNRTITISGKAWDVDGDPFRGYMEFSGNSYQDFSIPRGEFTTEPETDNFTLTWDVVDNKLPEGVYPSLAVYNGSAFGKVQVTHYPAKIIIDKTPPTAPTLQFTSPAGYTSGTETSQAVTFRIIDGTDATSGVLKSQYRTRQGSGTWGPWTDYSTSVTIRAPGSTQIEAKTQDRAGYESTTTTAQVVIINSPPPYYPPSPSNPVTGIRLNLESLSLNVGDSGARLQVMITPSNATNQQVKWTSSNPEVATVDQNGEVKPVAPGQTTITVTTIDGSYTASCTLYVAAKGDRLIKLKTVKHVRLKPKASEKFSVYAVYEGGREQEITKDPNIQYSSSSSEIATVKSGSIKAGKKEGKATIKVKYGGQTANILATVSKWEVKELLLPANKLTLEVAETKDLVAKAKLSNRTTEDVTQEATWTSDNTDVLTVEDGKLQAIAPGKTTITVSYGGKDAKLNVEVTDAKKVTRLAVNKRNVNLAVGKTQEIKLTAFYQDRSKAIVTDKAEWQTSNEQIATVKNGVITAVAPGTATIQAKYQEKTIFITVTVKQ